jgi:hypothetical protein
MCLTDQYPISEYIVIKEKGYMGKKEEEVAEMVVLAKPSNEAFIVDRDKVQEFLALKPNKKANAASRKRAENFKKIYVR